jgi:NNP family nitrate/nitrite transporter-like MFS transporter
VPREYIKLDQQEMQLQELSMSRTAEDRPSFLTLTRRLSFLVFIFLVNFISRVILSPLLPTIEKELKISHGEAGSLFFLISAGYLLGLLGSAFLASRFTHKATIVVSSSGVGIALLVVCLADSLWPIRVGLLVVGFAAGLYMPSAIATITSLIAQPHWGKAIAVHELAPNVAFFTAPFLAELFLRFSTWRMALGFLGAAALCLGLGYLRFGRGGEFPGESPASGAFGALARTPAFWLMILMFGLGVGSTVGVYAMLPLYLVSERHMDSTFANTVLAFSRSYGPILGLVGGWVSDKLGPKRTMVTSLVLTGIFTLLLGPAPTEWLSAIVLLQPMLAVWFFPAGFAALAMITPANARNLSVGFTVPFGFLIGGGVIPTLIGVMGDAGSFARGYILTGLLIFLSGLLALRLKLPTHRAQLN